jgi:hypothetical protein
MLGGGPGRDTSFAGGGNGSGRFGGSAGKGMLGGDRGGGRPTTGMLRRGVTNFCSNPAGRCSLSALDEGFWAVCVSMAGT